MRIPSVSDLQILGLTAGVRYMQRPGIAQQTRGLTLALALKLVARLVELGLDRLSAIEITPRITPRQRPFALIYLHTLRKALSPINSDFGTTPIFFSTY